MAAAIRAEIPQAEVRLFGSRARGQAGPDSDADLLITVPDAWLTQHNRLQVLGRLSRQEAQRMGELTGFPASSIGFLLQQADGPALLLVGGLPPAGA